MKIIGLAGKAGAGKDYVYATIDKAVTAHKAVRRMAFADGVKVDIERSINMERNMAPLWSKPYSHEVRALLQWWGTDFRRNEDPDYWVKFGVERLKELQAAGTDVVCVTDVRFQNEVDIIHRMGGVVFEVTAHAYVRAERLNINEAEQKAMESHATEKGGLEHIDGTIENTSYPVFPAELNMYLELPQGFQPERVADVMGLTNE